jgi:hypothetical protein
VPAVASAPLQPPDAVHVAALVELHDSVDAPPAVTLVGFALNVAVGATLTAILTVAAGLVPPAPVQVSENVVSAVSAPAPRVPLAASAPLQPPEALQDVAPVELQVNVDSSPLLTVVLDALIEAVGSGLIGEGSTLPPPHAAKNRAPPSAVMRVSDPMEFFRFVSCCANGR